MSGRLTKPVRKCIGCRERADQQSLVRFVGQKDAGSPAWIIIPDVHGSLPGRGAHLHPTNRCLDQAKRRRAFGRALRIEGPVDLSRVDALARTWPDE